MKDLLKKVKLCLEKNEISKKINRKDTFVLFILLGVLFLVIKMPVASKKESIKEVTKNQTEESLKKIDDTMTAYRKDLEERTEWILSQIEGVGEVSVMITLKNEGDTVFEKDFEKDSHQEITTDSQGGKKETKEEHHKETTLFYENEYGSEVPMVETKNYPKIEGILIVTRAAGQSELKYQIASACQALFDVEAHKIVIIKGNADERRTE